MRIVYFDFTDVSRGISKWIAIGDDDYLIIRYGTSSSNTELLSVQGEYFGNYATKSEN